MRSLQQYIVVFGVAAMVCGVSLTFMHPGRVLAQSTAAPTSRTTSPALGTGLAFETSGTASAVYAYVGKHVTKGQVLAALDSVEMLAQLRDAQAVLEYQTIKLGQLKSVAGTSSVDAITLQSYQTALDDTKQSVVGTLQDSFVKAEDAVRNRADQIFSATQYGSQVTLANVNQSAANQLSADRIALEAVLSAWRLSLDSLTAADDVNMYMTYALQNLNKVRVFLGSTVVLVNTALPDNVVSQTGLKNIKNDLNLGRSNTLAAINQVIAARSKEHDAEKKLALQQAAMAKGDPATAVLLQAAVVKQAQSKVDLLQARIDRMTLRAPVDGTVTAVSIALGGTVGARVPVLYVRPSATSSTNVVSLVSNSRGQVASVFTAVAHLVLGF